MFFRYNGEAVVQGSLDIGMPIIYVSMNYRWVHLTVVGHLSLTDR